MPRVIELHLAQSAPAEVELCLATAGFVQPTPPDDTWRFPSLESTVLYVSISASYAEFREVDEEAYQRIVSALGDTHPSTRLFVEISNRHPGDSELRFLVQLLLSRFNGVAVDEYEPGHCWYLAEIETGSRVNGHTFFDYQAFNDSRHTVRFPLDSE